MALATLGAQGFEVCALDVSGETSVFEYAPPHRCVAVVGSETAGISDETRDVCDTLLSIPMSDRVESLNAAVASSILCFAMVNNSTKG